jgi:MFS family permease
MTVLALLSLAELLGMSLWFSATAVVPALTREWQLSSGDQAWLTMSVQCGFVIGTLLSAVLTISDVFSARSVFSISAVLAALANLAIPLFATSLELTLVFRFLTGVFLAGVYPPGMKIMATWFKRGRGMAIGALVGALTIGSASPHLLTLLGTPDWRTLMMTASALALVAAGICALFVSAGPYDLGTAEFDWRFAARALRNRGVRLVNFGYLGHQWELYAMWTWLPMFLLASFEDSGVPNSAALASAGAFAAIAVGGVSSVLAGIAADRFGRRAIAIVSLLVSGTCCVFVGQLYGGAPYVLLAACMIWGFAIIADSAQYSASVTELTEPAYVGTALTLQTCLGFLLTLGSIRVIPIVVELVGWEWAFVALAPGPAVGVVAMHLLGQQGTKKGEPCRVVGGRS